MSFDFFKDKFLMKEASMSLEEYLEEAKTNSVLYSTPAERLLKAIGEPILLDTAKDPRLARLFGRRVIKLYKPFIEVFFGLEDVIEQSVAFLKHAAQGLEASKQILYWLGPVGSAKSSLAETFKSLITVEPFYAIEGSPIHDNPLGLFSRDDEKTLGIPSQYLTAQRINGRTRYNISPWLYKRLQELEGDLTKLRVVKLYPDQNRQIAVAKTEPGDENNQDISALVGKLDIRKLEFFKQDDPDAYNFNGGLCKGHRGILEFVEMFKAPIKVLHPLLTATQEGNYNPTEAMAAIPWEGIVLAHSNESEFEQFRNNKNNEAFLDRINLIKVPYNTKLDEEVKIYLKHIKNSSLKDAPCAPHTLETLAAFDILTRLELPENSPAHVKLKVYNGQNIKEQHPNAKSYDEYKSAASNHEGFFGVSTRFAHKILSQTYNYDPSELAANPVHLLYLLEKSISEDDIPEDAKTRRRAFIKDILRPQYIEVLTKHIQVAFLDGHADYAQHMFDRYIKYADAWLQDQDHRDPDTGDLLDREALNRQLEKTEKAAGISNPKDFRHEIVTFSLRYAAANGGKNPSWKSYKKMEEVIEKNMFTSMKELLPVISFDTHRSKEDSKKYAAFVKNMAELGYTEKQIKLVVEYQQRYSKTT